MERILTASRQPATASRAAPFLCTTSTLPCCYYLQCYICAYCFAITAQLFAETLGGRDHQINSLDCLSSTPPALQCNIRSDVSQPGLSAAVESERCYTNLTICRWMVSATAEWAVRAKTQSQSKSSTLPFPQFIELTMHAKKS